ncbi:hypothetical protein C1H46_039283 [Malus baccata]|uniref:Cationic amino acid transporter C-terminal domain-containing protein n=1 Tax=Malus baccata TaxID=106549 RepID=A0A540KLT6_MALBA|nr:hypothetical protein C1H46_039283 [Malus baccata]
MVAGGGGDDEGIRRRGCTYRRNDFLPEESFQSWWNYVHALCQTPGRFMDRVLTRSADSTELVEMKARSHNEMKKTLNWWDLIWFGLGAVIGAGIFVLTGLEAKNHAGPAVVLSYVVSGVSALLSVFCYTEFAVEIPVAGGSFAYLRVELGDFVAFIAAGNILLEYVIGGAAVARSWTSYFTTLCNRSDTNDFRIIAHDLPEDYRFLDPIAVVVIIGICCLAVLSTKGSSRLNYIASIVHVIVIIFIIIAGLTKADTKNYIDFAPFGPRGVFQASAVLFFAYVGFDAVSTMAEETKNPARDIPIGLPYKTGTPVNATVTMLAATAIIAFFSSLDVLANLLSISTLFIFSLVAMALLVRRYYVSGVTTQANRNKFIACLFIIITSSISTSIYWSRTDKWTAYVVTAPLWFLGTFGIWLLVPQARDPKLWGVPLVPWLPSISIAINIFLLGSIDHASFVRFGVWTVIILVYYFFFGLHASYDTAKDSEAKRLEGGTGNELWKVEAAGVATRDSGLGSGNGSYASATPAN